MIKIKVFAIFFLILRIELAFSADDEVVTQWPLHETPNNNKKSKVDFPITNLVNRGMSSVESSPYTPSRKKPVSRLDRIDKSNQSPDLSVKTRPNLPYGKVITAPTSIPRAPSPIQTPPEISTAGKIRLGNIGGFKSHPLIIPAPALPGTSHGEIYGDHRGGERKETYGFDRYRPGGVGGANTKDSFVPQQQLNVYESEDELIKDTHDGVECQARCEDIEFFCVQSCTCLHKNLRCDGNIDCMPYGEDEKDCDELNEEILKNLRTDCEKSGERILCPTTFACISKEWLCDGDDDCGDFSDETRCGERRNCTRDQFECINGLCIPEDWVCDGDNDCKDYSDELNCTRTCSKNEFTCSDGSCVSLDYQCDGETDCNDGSDELNCEHRMARCPEGEFKCRGSLGGMGGTGADRCILMRYRCDGDNDCGDWSDEENCPRKQSTCTQTEFKCDDGTCISMRWRCDQEQDCDSGEDEKGCPKVEKDSRTCKPDEFKCHDEKCILKTWLCDGIPDCKRGEDEINCEVKCEVGQFACPQIRANSSSQRICVNQKHICDGHNDCPNGADEENCPIEHPCGAHSRCEQLCITNYQAREECACKIGFVLAQNGYNCTDINECEFSFNPVCSQNCTNTYGSFRCSCYDGYVLRPDLRTCKAMGGAVNLIMANRADIRQVSISNNRYISLIKGLPNAISVDFHYKKNLLFWSDVSTDVIKRAYVNGSQVRDVIKWGLESPGGIAIDWVHDLIFWTDSGTRRIEVSNLDGTLRAVIAANDLDKPRAIVIHPGHALVFWTDWGPNAKIERAYMDGQERKVITNEGIFWPNGLALDYVTDRLFWADAKHHVIESSALDGSDRKKVMSANLPHPFALTIFEDNMFWTDWRTKSISTANKVTGKGYHHVHNDLHFPMDLHSFHASRQPTYQNKCRDSKSGLSRIGKANGCSHLCLPTKNGRRCACPIGLTLMDDRKTCTSEPDKLLLVARKKDIRIRQLNSKEPDKEIDMVIPLDGLKNIIAIDWCSDTNVIYWGDVGRNVIAKAFLNGSNQETVISSNLQQPAGLAVDWVTDKLYWTDSGTNRIEVATTDGNYRALLIWQKIDKPRDIVVSPVDGLMFWSDWGSTPLIERAGMDGSGRHSIVSENIGWPNGLAIDRSNSRLYFVDAGTKTLEYVNFDGTGRNRLIADGLIHPFGLDVHGGRIFWTDWETQSVQYTDELSASAKYHQSGKNRRTIISNLTDLMDVRIFHRNRKDIHNPCAINNGDCSHMCLLNPKGYSCACPIGVLLTEDRQTCESGPKNYILFAHRIDIRQISLDIDHLIDVVLPLPPLQNALTLDVDTKTGDIYWADTEDDTITKSSSDGRHVSIILTESMDTVDGLVVDSVGRKLYWTDSGRHAIEVSELDGSNRNVLIWQDIESPRGIAIDYEFGYLFWTDWGSSPRIERADMDGEKRSRIVTTDVIWPNGLAVDNQKKRIFWTDAKRNHIMSSDFEGNFRKVIAKNLEHPYGVAVGIHEIYYTDWKTNALHSVTAVNDMYEIKTISKDLEGLMDVKVIETGKERFTNACKRNNGGCSHLCLRKPNSYSCKCPTGIKLKEGSLTECESMPQTYLLVALRSGIARISLDTPELFDVVLPIEGVHGAVVLDYHYQNSQIFYADVNIDSIRRVNMYNHSDSKTIIRSGLNTPNGLAVDWIANNLYWSDSQMKVIEVSRLDGTSRKRLIYADLEDPRSIILYPKKAYLFWCDWGTNPRIERSFLNGQDRKIIINSDIGFPIGLAVDFESKQLYWADALNDRIERCDFDGKHRTKVISPAYHPFGFTVHGSNIYWTDWYNKSVLRAPKSAGSVQVEQIRHGLRGAMDVRAVAPDRQPYDVNPCASQNGDCTHLCLLGKVSYSCECPDKPDSRTCKTRTVPIVTDDDDEESPPLDKWPPKTPKQARDDSSRIAKAFVTATTVLGIILFIVVFAILCLMYSPKRRKNKKSSTGSNRSVLTFANPNYNGADALNQPGHSRHQSNKNSGLWRKLRYDKGQDRVYEVKCLGLPDTATTTTLMSGTPSPSSSAILPLSTIG